VRKLVKSKAAWASETALIKELYLSMSKNEKSWKKRLMAGRRYSEILSNCIRKDYHKKTSLTKSKT